MTDAARLQQARRNVAAARRAQFNREVEAELTAMTHRENLQLLSIGLGRYAHDQRAEREQEQARP